MRDADRVFRVSSSLLRWLKQDAEWAGIGLCDARGRSTTVHGIRAGFNTTLRRNATDPSLRMRLMRHKSTDLGLGTYDKVEVDELRRELERLPVASALRAAAGAESVTVPVTVRPRPLGAVPGRSGPLDAPSTTIAESANVGQTRRSRPPLAAPGRSGPERAEGDELVGPAGLEPAIAKSQALHCGRVTNTALGSASTSDSTALAGAQRFAETVREMLAAGGPQLPRSVRRELARLLSATRLIAPQGRAQGATEARVHLDVCRDARAHVGAMRRPGCPASPTQGPCGDRGLSS